MDDLKWAEWKFWLYLLQLIVTACVGIYVWLSNRDKARNKDMQRVENRVTKLEECTISHEDIGKVYDRINEVWGAVREQNGTMKGVAAAVDMIQEHLLNGGGK